MSWIIYPQITTKIAKGRLSFHCFAISMMRPHRIAVPTKTPLGTAGNKLRR
jgi:hypothetical protein